MNISMLDLGVPQDPKTVVYTAEESQADEAQACVTAGNCLEIETCHLQQRHRVVIRSHYSTGFAQNSVNEVSRTIPQ